MLGRIIKIFFFSIPQRKSFLLGRIIRISISSNLQRRPSIFREFLMLGIMIHNNIHFFQFSKKIQHIQGVFFFLLGRIMKIFILSIL